MIDGQPVSAVDTGNLSEVQPKKRAVKAFTRFITVVLALVLAGLVFIYFSPDYSIHQVRSESMRPAINMGDVIVTGPVGNPFRGDIKPGTIVTYQYGPALITHRVLAIDGDILITKGDAVEDPDVAPTSLSSVSGVYLFKIPYLGYVSNFIRTKRGWFVAVLIPAAVLVGFLAQSIRKELRKRSEEIAGERR